MSNYKINFDYKLIQILNIKYEWNLPSLSLALFFFNHIEFRKMCYVMYIITLVHEDHETRETFYVSNFNTI